MHKVVSYILVALILAGCGGSVDVRLKVAEWQKPAIMSHSSRNGVHTSTL